MISLVTRSFSWEGETGTAEASDLLTSYPDQLILESSRTGRAVILHREHQEIADGDLLFTRYVSVRQPRVCIVIFND